MRTHPPTLRVDRRFRNGVYGACVAQSSINGIHHLLPPNHPTFFCHLSCKDRIMQQPQQPAVVPCRSVEGSRQQLLAHSLSELIRGHENSTYKPLKGTVTCLWVYLGSPGFRCCPGTTISSIRVTLKSASNLSNNLNAHPTHRAEAPPNCAKMTLETHHPTCTHTHIHGSYTVVVNSLRVSLPTCQLWKL